MLTLFLLFLPLTTYGLMDRISDYFMFSAQTVQEVQEICQRSSNPDDYSTLQKRALNQMPWYLRWADWVERFVEPSKEAKLAQAWSQLGLILQDSLHGLIFYTPYAGAAWSDPIVQQALQTRFGTHEPFKQLAKAMSDLGRVHDGLLIKLKKANSMSWFSRRTYYTESEKPLRELIDSVLQLYLDITLAINALEPAEVAPNTIRLFRPTFMKAIIEATERVHRVQGELDLLDLALVRRWYHKAIVQRLPAYMVRYCNQTFPLSR